MLENIAGAGVMYAYTCMGAVELTAGGLGLAAACCAESALSQLAAAPCPGPTPTSCAAHRTGVGLILRLHYALRLALDLRCRWHLRACARVSGLWSGHSVVCVCAGHWVLASGTL